MLKKLLANLLASILTLVAMVVPLQAQSITLTFNSQVLEPTVAPVMVNGITYIPLRIVADKLGAQTIYTKTSKNEYIEIIKDNTTIKLAVRPEKGYPQVNGKEVSMNVAPKIVNSTTMVPVRFVSENLGCKVDYDSKTNTVAVSENGYVGSGITVKIDDKVAKLTQPAFVKNGVVYVPADIVKELGATIESKVGYVIKRKDIELNTSPLSPVFRVNWTRVPVKSIPKQIGKDLFIPDEILTYMNCDTEYDEATKTLSIINKGLIKVELSQERYVDLTGRVLYPDGTPAKNMKVKFSPTDASGADWGFSYYGRRGLKPIEPVYTDENGYFVFKDFDTETFPFGKVSIGTDDETDEVPKGEWGGGTGTEVDPELLYNTKRAGVLMPGLNLKRGNLGTIYLFKNEQLDINDYIKLIDS